MYLPLALRWLLVFLLQVLLTYATANNFSSSAKNMDLCTTPPNATVWTLFMSALTQAYSEISQFSFGKTLGAWQANAPYLLINGTPAASDPVQIVNACQQKYFYRSVALFK